MSEPAVKRIDAGEAGGLPEVLQSVRSTAGDRATIVIPPKSGLLLTASEFRALKTTAEQVGVTVTVETDDRLRRQLAKMFTVEWQPLPVVAQVVKAQAAWPTRRAEATDEPEPVDEGPEVVAEERIELTTSKPWKAEVIDASRETALPPPPSMIPEVVDDVAGMPRVDPDRRRAVAARRRGLIIGGGILVGVLLLGMLGSVWLRSATVRVTLKRQPVASEVIFGVRTEGVDSIDGAAFMVDASPVRFESTYTTTVPVEGTVTEQTSPATGELQLRNIGDDVSIPVGTEFATRDGVRYRTLADAELDGGSTERPAEGTVAIESVTGGDVANVDVGTLVGPLDGFEGVYYANLDGPVAGGEGRSAPGVSSDDSDAIVALAQSELDKQAAATTVEGGARVVPSSLAPEGGITYTLDHEVGDVADTLTIDAKLTYVALAIDPATVGQQADEALRANLAAAAAAGYEIDPATVVIGTADGVPDATDGSMRITATAEARATLDDAERDQLAEEMSGKSQVDAQTAALANPDVADLTIDVSPGWLTDSLPGAGRITVTTA